MHVIMMRAMRDELTKEALLKEVVALGLKDIPGTPRLIMKHRGAAQRAAAGLAAEAGWKKHLTDPIMRVAEKGLQRVPAGKAQDVARKVTQTIADDPLGGTITAVAPGGVVVPFLKKGLRKGIQLIDPQATRLMAQQV